MEKSTVYFTDFRCPVGTSQLDKLKKLCVTAGIKDIDMDGKFVAIKMHFGELGNLAFLRPNYAKAVADLCKEQEDFRSSQTATLFIREAVRMHWSIWSAQILTDLTAFQQDARSSSVMAYAVQTK